MSNPSESILYVCRMFVVAAVADVDSNSLYLWNKYESGSSEVVEVMEFSKPINRCTYAEIFFKNDDAILFAFHTMELSRMKERKSKNCTAG